MDVVGRYLELGLRLGRHVDGLVDAYYGPPGLKGRVDEEEPVEPAALAREADALLADVAADGLAPRRRRWLGAQLTGLRTVARKLAGDEIPYADEVELCYGVRPSRAPEAQFLAAHELLDEALPGEGPLAERYQAWRETPAIEADRLRPLLEALSESLRARTAERLGLPDGEEAELDLVRDEPWAAFNYYLGGLRSRVVVNTDVSMAPSLVVELVAHELYPGHHTEHAWKEQRLVRELGCLEESIFLVGTPQALVSEGIAGLGLDVLLGESADDFAAEHLARAGIAYDPQRARAIRAARRGLDGVVANAALLLHEDGAPRDEATAYVRRFGLSSERRAEQSIRFVVDPVWRAYVSTYTDGRRVCDEYVRGDPARFRTLLVEQLTPADLTAGTS